MRCQLLSIRADVFRTKRDVAFHDDSPILIISESSLEELNRRLADPLPMNRFRPNIVVRDATPFDEDGWQRIAIGDAVFRAIKACERCVITTVDQAAGTFAAPNHLPPWRSSDVKVKASRSANTTGPNRPLRPSDSATP